MKLNIVLSGLIGVFILGSFGFGPLFVEASSHEVILGGTSGEEDALMYFIDPNNGTPIEFLGELIDENGRSRGLSGMDVNATERIFSGGNNQDKQIREIFLQPDGVLGTIVIDNDEENYNCNGASFSPEGEFYCYDTRKGGLFLIDLDAGTNTLVVPVDHVRGAGGNGLAVSVDGAIYHGNKTGLNVLDPTTGTRITSLPWEFDSGIENSENCRPSAMDFSSEGILFASLNCTTGFPPRGIVYLVTIDTATAQITLIGTTVPLLDAITFVQGPEPNASIQGMKWNDANQDGIWDPEEQGVSDVEICIFRNIGFGGDGEFPQPVVFENPFGIQIAEANIGPIGDFKEIACTMTDQNGEYLFENIFPGFYMVEEFPIDQIQVFPDREYIDDHGQCPFFYESSCLDLLDFHHPNDANPSLPHFIEVQNEEHLQDVNFGNIPAGFLQGMKWNDVNQDGIKDIDEVGVPGIEVLLFQLTHPDTLGEFVHSTHTMSDDPETLENEDGLYGFTVKPGTYRIIEVLPFGSSQTFPADSAPHYADVVAGEVVSGLDFGNTAALPGSIQGMKFSDINRNGIHDTGDLFEPDEPGVPNVTFCLSPTGSCTQTDGDGKFSFENISPGEYVVSETVPSNSVNTTPMVLSVLVTSDNETFISFGNTAQIPPPSEVTVSPLNNLGSGGLPSVNWQNNITVSKDTGSTGFDHCGDDSPISVTLQLDFTETATVELIPMDLIGPGDVYSTILPPFHPLHGLLNLTFLVECPGNLNPDGADEIQVGGSIYIDPSGQITDVCTDSPIEGAQVTLLKEYPPTGEFFIAEETDYIEDTGSVQTTGADGRYAWNTVAGNYKVSASADGFITQESPIVPIPPPVLDLDVTLERVNGCTTDPVTSDHYLSYKAKQPKGDPKFEKFTVTLDDQFESASYTVDKPDRLFNPIQKTHDDIITEITDYESHYVGYKIKTPKGTDKFENIKGVSVTDQFGELTIDIKKSKLLLVPSAKNHDVTPDELNPVAVDHFKCYDVKETKHAPKFKKLTVSVYDPNFEITQDFEVKKPKMLCVPVEKTHDITTSEINNPENNLTCYDVKEKKGSEKFEKRNIFTNNQFGPEELKVEKQEELCVPSNILE